MDGVERFNGRPDNKGTESLLNKLPLSRPPYVPKACPGVSEIKVKWMITPTNFYKGKMQKKRLHFCSGIINPG